LLCPCTRCCREPARGGAVSPGSPSRDSQTTPPEASRTAAEPSRKSSSFPVTETCEKDAAGKAAKEKSAKERMRTLKRAVISRELKLEVSEEKAVIRKGLR